MRESEVLTQRILQSSDWGVAANDMLSEFHRGRPVEQLRPLLRSLLRSREPLVVRAASFIADELGGKAVTLLEEVSELLGYPDRHVRGNAIGSLLTCAGADHPAQITAVISLLGDSDWPIRWKTMEFLSRASIPQLQAASKHLQRLGAWSDHPAGLVWLLGDGGQEFNQINAWVGSNSSLSRKYGVVAATRLASVNEQPLRSAASSPDEDVQRFADSMLQMRLASV
jgi:hypothetical protein